MTRCSLYHWDLPKVKIAISFGVHVSYSSPIMSPRMSHQRLNQLKKNSPEWYWCLIKRIACGNAVTRIELGALLHFINVFQNSIVDRRAIGHMSIHGAEGGELYKKRKSRASFPLQISMVHDGFNLNEKAKTTDALGSSARSRDKVHPRSTWWVIM